MQGRGATNTESLSGENVVTDDATVMTKQITSRIHYETPSKVVDVTRESVKTVLNPTKIPSISVEPEAENVIDEEDEEEEEEERVEDKLAERLIPGLHLFAQTGNIKFLLMAVRRLIDTTNNDGDK